MQVKGGRADEALLLDAALENIPYGFCAWSPDFTLVMWNKHYRDIYGFPADRLSKGMALRDVARLSTEMGNHPNHSPDEFYETYRRDLLANRAGAKAVSLETLSGGRTVETAHIYSPGLGWVVTHEDVTEAIAREEIIQKRKRELERQNIRLEAAVNNISQGLCMFDANGRLVICNAPYAQIYELPERLLKPGTPLEQILAYLFDHGLHSDGDRDAYIMWRRDIIARQEYGKNVHQLGGRTILMQHHPMKDGGWVSTHEDITEQRKSEARIRHLARHDALTDLPNRIQFLEQMQLAEAAIARGEAAAVLCIDIDHFKAINDTLGHAVGDALLKQVSARLWGKTRETDVLARVGGDEFSLLLRPIESGATAAMVADRIIKAMAMPFLIEGHQILTSASVGIALAPSDGTATDDLMRNADLALLKAKREGRSTYRYFESGMDQAMQRRRFIEAGLKRALAQHELHLVFQPLIDLKTNSIKGFEALLRWDHPEQGPIAPGEFIPVAEDTGLIVSIGEWVLRESCRHAATWPGRVRVAVNLSPVQFRGRNLCDMVLAAIRDARLAPGRVELEITESLMLEENEPVLKALHRLRAAGVRIAMDDFGSGYSSLSYLRSFPFDKIKIDRSFMADIDKRADSVAIIKAIVGLGRNFGMTTTAEGIETEDQLATVMAEGCDEAQGFLFSPPLPAVAARNLLKATEEQGFLVLKRLAHERQRSELRVRA